MGGLGCSWAKALGQNDSEADILLIDADDESFSSIQQGHFTIGTVVDKLGCAALPPLAEQRMKYLYRS